MTQLSAENRAIRLTVIGNLGMALLGLGFAIGTHSEAILLDGFFSLITFVIALLTQKVSHLVEQPGNQHYPFGYAIFEPLLNLKKGMLVATVCLFALVSAIEALLEGGRPISEITAVAYAGIAAIGCFFIAWRVKTLSIRSHSLLVKVDIQNWIIDGLISAAVAVTFLMVWLARDTPFAAFAPYADPVLVIILVVSVASMPLQTIREAWNQIVRYRPNYTHAARIETAISETLSEVPVDSFQSRATEVGRFLYVQVYVVVTEGNCDHIHQQDQLRTLLYNCLAKDFPRVRMDLIFTQNPIWAQRTLG